jgi:hypothetical protein
MAASSERSSIREFLFRKIPRDIRAHACGVARSLAGTEDFETPRHERRKLEMRFADLKRILKLGRLRLRGRRGAQDEFVLAAIAGNLRRLATLSRGRHRHMILCSVKLELRRGRQAWQIKAGCLQTNA